MRPRDLYEISTKPHAREGSHRRLTPAPVSCDGFERGLALGRKGWLGVRLDLEGELVVPLRDEIDLNVLVT